MPHIDDAGAVFTHGLGTIEIGMLLLDGLSVGNQPIGDGVTLLTDGFGAEEPGLLLTDGYGGPWTGYSSLPTIEDAGKLLPQGFGTGLAGDLVTGGYGQQTGEAMQAGRLVTYGLGDDEAFMLAGGYGDFIGTGPMGGGARRLRGLHLLNRLRWW